MQVFFYFECLILFLSVLLGWDEGGVDGLLVLPDILCDWYEENILLFILMCSLDSLI